MHIHFLLASLYHQAKLFPYYLVIGSWAVFLSSRIYRKHKDPPLPCSTSIWLLAGTYLFVSSFVIVIFLVSIFNFFSDCKYFDTRLSRYWFQLAQMQAKHFKLQLQPAESAPWYYIRYDDFSLFVNRIYLVSYRQQHDLNRVSNMSEKSSQPVPNIFCFAHRLSRFFAQDTWSISAKCGRRSVCKFLFYSLPNMGNWDMAFSNISQN